MSGISSVLGRLLGRTTSIEPHETRPVVTAFLLFFCVLGGYFAVRPVRETMGTILGSDRVSDLYVVTWVVSLLIVPVYGWACTRFRRSAFLPWIYAVVAGSLVVVGLMLAADEQNTLVAQFFYVWISVLNLFIVSVFWSFLLELFSAAQTQRLFGVIAAGGTTGALVGPLMTDLVVPLIGNSGVLFMGAGFFLVAILCQRALLGIWASAPAAAGGERAAERPMGGNPFAGFTLVLKSPYLLGIWASAPAAAGGERAAERPMGGNPFAGFTLVLKSPYLLGISLFVILLASVNTFLYFEQLRLVSETFTDTAQRTQVFARLDYIVQSLTIVLQLFITGRG
ncbi:MAG: hypothetical protein FJ170_08250, partial [Gammaproteobacteria bacterium]|nr:hypothetical protein [Gammaproteobacteria bacterium]